MDTNNFQEKTYVWAEPKELKWHHRPWDSLIFVLIAVLAITILCICQYVLKFNGNLSGIVAVLAAGLPIFLYINHLPSTMRRCTADFRTAEGFSTEDYVVGTRWNEKERQIIFTVKQAKGVENAATAGNEAGNLKKEVVLKQYWKAKKRVIISSVVAIVFWILALTGLGVCTTSFTSIMEPIEWVAVWILALCLAYLFGIVCSLKPLIRARKTIQKIKAEEYQIHEDIIVDKYVKKGPTVLTSKMYFIKFANYEPERSLGPHKNSILVDKKSYKKMQIGDVEHYLVLNDNKGLLSCFICPEAEATENQEAQNEDTGV